MVTTQLINTRFATLTDYERWAKEWVDTCLLVNPKSKNKINDGRFENRSEKGCEKEH